MVLEDIATIRTGVVATRKRAARNDSEMHEYKLLNLRCASVSGRLDLQYVEKFLTAELLKLDYFTQKNDIIVRLSAPYTPIMITEENLCGYLVPSHFAIIRVQEDKAAPEYILWLLKRDSTYQKILKNISGNGIFGTINSKFFNSLVIEDLPLQKQKTIGQMEILSEKEQELLQKLKFEKEKYNKLLIEKIYGSAKKGK